MKIKRFDISIEMLKVIFGPGRKDWEVECNALPEDAKIVRILSMDNYAASISTLSLFVISDTFPDVPDGSLLKPETIWIRQYHQD